MVYIVVLMSLALGWISATLLWRLHTAAAPIAKEAGQGDGADFGVCFARRHPVLLRFSPRVTWRELGCRPYRSCPRKFS